MTSAPPPGPPPSTAYEVWLRAMRSFACDPMTPIDHLPSLADDTYSPDTFVRIHDAVTMALESVTKQWVDGLQRAWRNASTPFELATGLSQSRVMLARRVQLARHPSLPPRMREGLERELRDSVARYQRELEESVHRAGPGHTVDHDWRDRMLAVVRENSLLKVLDYSMGADGRATTGPVPIASTPLPGSEPTSSGPPTQRWAHRRVTPAS